MNIIFMGTPDFAVPSLKKLFESSHTVKAVVTAPDKERGRGKKISSTPVKEFAVKNNIPVLEPLKLKDEQFIEQLKSFNADLFVIVAFRILPREVFTIPPKGSFNLHGSLLPRYRGAAPIQWAVINGDKETGVTTFFLEDKVDTGNMIMQEKIIIADEDDYGVVHDKLSLLGADAVLKTVDMIEAGSYPLLRQDNTLATAAPKITKDTGAINWNDEAFKIHNLIRGLSPYPGAYFFHNGKQIKVYKTKILESPQLKPGEIKQEKEDLYTGTGSGTLHILELQLEGKKRMLTSEFLRGFKF